MLRRAGEADAALFVRLNEEGGHGRLDASYVAMLLRGEPPAPGCSAWVDDVARAGAYFQIDVPAQEIALAWLLPRGVGFAAMKGLVLAGFEDVLQTYPRAATWTFYGDITARGGGEAAVRAWERVFKDAGCPFTAEYQQGTDHWRGRIPTLRAAVKVARKWR